MTSFLGRARSYVERRLPEVEPHGAEEIFLHLLARGADAREAGNYGIGAAYVVRHAGAELVFFGQSTIFTAQDPAGHAEMNALHRARRIATADEQELERVIGDSRSTLLRAAPHDRFETLLYSTLEPCPMCTVAILNSGVKEVILGLPDSDAGAILDLSTLPPLWGEFAAQRDLHVSAVGVGADAEHQVDSELLSLLQALFFDDKDPLDDRLVHQGALPNERLGALARRHLGERVR